MAPQEEGHCVLVINNNPNGAAGRYTPMLIQHLERAGLRVQESRTVQDTSALAAEAMAGGSVKVDLIITCGSPVVLTEPVDLFAHVAKTSAAMLHFPQAPVVGICFGMQLLTLLFGGSLVAKPLTRRGADGSVGAFTELRRTGAPSRLLDARRSFLQWNSNYIFLEQDPPGFVATAVDSEGHSVAIEHVEEHVYGVLFHPEQLGEGVERTVLDGIIGLVGRRRQMGQEQSHCRRSRSTPSSNSASAPVASAAAGRAEEGGVRGRARASSQRRRRKGRASQEEASQAGNGAALAARLAAAKREALAVLKRDHCKAGEVMWEALQDSIAALDQLAEAGEATQVAAADACQRQQPGKLGDEEEQRPRSCSLQEAELQLRQAVNRKLCGTLPAKEDDQGGATTATVSGATTASAAPATTDRGGEVSTSGGVACTTPLECRGGGGSSLPSTAEGEEAPLLTPHAADLKLRQAVQQLLQAKGQSGALAQALAAARREALVQLRLARDLEGLVAAPAVEKALAALRQAAAAAASI